MFLADIGRGFTSSYTLLERNIRQIQLSFLTPAYILEYRSYHREYHLSESSRKKTCFFHALYDSLYLSDPRILEYPRARKDSRYVLYSPGTRISRGTLLRLSGQSLGVVLLRPPLKRPRYRLYLSTLWICPLPRRGGHDVYLMKNPRNRLISRYLSLSMTSRDIRTVWREKRNRDKGLKFKI